ncbi:MAG: Do family serine endopeptidase, partial [Hyphomicrobiales bacterium]
ERMPQRRTLAQGSGFIISADGYVVTNQHVVDEASEIRVTMDNGEKHDAEVVGIDQRTDLALLKIKSNGETFKYVEFADKQARVGDWVVAVGNPFGLGGTVTAGIVSAHNRDIGSSPYDYLQIDAAVNRGNSGGPTFNLDGKVVGVNTAIFSPSGGNVGIAFAVPAQLAKQVTAQLRESGSVSRGWLGVSIQQVTEDIASSLGMKQPRGALITALTEGGPAEKSKVQPGDVVTKVNGDSIEDSRDLARKVAAIPPGTKVQVTVIRDGDEKVLPVELGSFPGPKQLAELRDGKSPTPNAPKSEAEALGDIGLTLAPASSVAGSGEEGVVITEVDPASNAAEKGLKAGDVILEVAGQSVSRPGDVSEGVKRAKDRGRGAVLMRVKSGDQQRFVAIPLKKA